jgi:hypothetical protein
MKINKNKLKGRPFICYKIPNKKKILYILKIFLLLFSRKNLSLHGLLFFFNKSFGKRNKHW